MSRRQVNSKKSTESMKKITQRLLVRERVKRKKLLELGIDYEFPGYKFSNEEVIKRKETNNNSLPVDTNEKKLETGSETTSKIADLEKERVDLVSFLSFFNNFTMNS